MVDGLRLNGLSIRVDTANGSYGVDIPFANGLFILQAENSMGKSTVVQSIIYAFGLEGMLSASRDVPLPHVMTHVLHDGAEKYLVNSSWVEVSFSNTKGRRARVRRQILNSRAVNYVSVVEEGENGNDRLSGDYYVREGGAATNEGGFHRWFAAFLGWKLPEVLRYDGSRCLLYVECMFPLLIVEQKRAWTGIQARMPVHYRIRDVGRRSIEFLLGLDVFETLAKRQELRQQMDALKTEWSALIADASARARFANGILTGIDDAPVEVSKLNARIALLIPYKQEWRDAGDFLVELRGRMSKFEAEEIPTVGEVSVDLKVNFEKAQARFSEIQFSISELNNDLDIDKIQLESLERRISALEESERKNKDARKLSKMGAAAGLKSSSGHCPTCNQHVSDSLILMGESNPTMLIEDNISYIENQLLLFRANQEEVRRSVVAKNGMISALREEEKEVAGRLRALKETLIGPASSPSVAAVEERLALRDRVERIQEAVDGIEEISEKIKELSSRWTDLKDKSKEIPSDDLSEEDKEKVKKLEGIFRECAREFGVTSLDPRSISLSRETFKPEHGGFDLEFDLSASDLVRTIWAYLLSLLELSRSEKTNHLGLLILDEPRQQETNRVSFKEFFSRASRAGSYGEQIIVATSEKLETLESLVKGVPHVLLSFSDHILKKIDAN